MQEFTYKLMEDSKLCITGYRGDEAEVVIPDYAGRVTALFDGLFAGHSEIRSLRIPPTVTDLGEFLLDGCTGLTRLTLPAGLKTLWGSTFARCSLEQIELPDGVVSIPPFAFKDCQRLKRVVCGSGLRQIHAWAFSGCTQLTELVHGPSVTVSPEAFSSK